MNPNTTDTLIGEGSVFEGHLRSEAGIRIEGLINGDVVAKGDVTVGERGIVRSNISARQLVIAGEVHGNVSCEGRVIIRPTGRLFGNSNALSLVIDEGGIFQGMSKSEVVVPDNGSSVQASAGTDSRVPDGNQKPVAAAFGSGPTVVL